MEKNLPFVILLFCLHSCIEPFNPDLSVSDTRLLVIEGQITDETGPFRVKLSHTFDINDLQQYGEPETNANVHIADSEGNLYPLYYKGNGWYETEDKHLKGTPGIIYTLDISREDGSRYESTPVLMPDVPDIDTVYFEELTRTRFENGKAIDENCLGIFVDSKDPTGETRYWKWDFTETWEVRTPKKDVRILVQPTTGPSYYIVSEVEFIEGNATRGWDNKKERCWVTVPSTAILISSTANNTDNEIKKFPLTSIAPSNDRLYIRYSILVRQTSLSKELYQYWKKLKEANEETGSIYDRLPSQIFGNIQCCDEGKDKALGYFAASAVRSKRIFIDQSGHGVEAIDAYADCVFNFAVPRVKNYYLGHIVAVADSVYAGVIGQKVYSLATWCPDCREYGSNVKPDFW